MRIKAKAQTSQNSRRGRPPRTRAERICAAPWYQVVRRAVAQRCNVDIETLNPARLRNLLEETVGEVDEVVLSADAWSYYRQGRRLPDQKSVDALDRIFPATSEVLEYGPGRSYLWQVLGDQPESVIGAIEREWRAGVLVRDAGKSGKGIVYRVMPRSIAARRGLSPNETFAVADAGELLQPWQEVDEYLGQWVNINSPLPGRRTLPFGPEPARSMLRARLGASNTRNAVMLPALASMSYDIAHARLLNRRVVFNARLLARYGVSASDLRTCFGTALS